MSEVLSIEDRVKAIIAEQVCESTVALDKSLAKDYGADSLDQVEIVIFIEDEFGIEIDDEVAWKLNTVQQFVDAVRSRIGKG